MQHFKIIFFLIIISFGFSITLEAQIRVGQDTIFGNEWLEKGRDYIKLKLSENGIYRISGEDLEGAGFPLGSVNGSDISLFRYGIEEPLFVSQSGQINAGDFIEFAGERNGTLPDSYLFEEGEEGLLNPYYSLFSDSSAYFISWSPTLGQKLRYENDANTTTGNEQVQSSFRHTEIVNYNNQFINLNYRGQTVSHFNANTGFASGLARTINVPVPTIQRVVGGMAEVKVKLVTGSRTSNQPEKNLQILVNGDIYIDEFVQGNSVLEYVFEVPTSALTNSTTVRIYGAGSAADRYQVAYASITYDRNFNFTGDGVVHWMEQNFPANSEIQLSMGGEDENVVVLDRFNRKRTVIERS